ncbi:HEAT repeat domain-containing protein [Engelhardtia mirabilis]|uniref:Tetratricopeptide repeat protein n=1 Tax=Engelhardtia mirabilis TaxID=2528011 RepID=A0A518BMR6_9BACT|nr:hypothetical protein Pla133_33420 [Planctomycetes bacterium Pla133]QDV02573.1 hypothetical protein Pla86_33410 [Planctomycetes bacterium Pla86]
MGAGTFLLALLPLLAPAAARPQDAPLAADASLDSDLDRRVRAAELASPGGPIPTDRELATLAADVDPTVRVLAARAAGRVDLGARDVGPRVALLKQAAAEDPDRAVRAAAVETLGALGGPTSGGALVELLGLLDGDDLVGAAEALAETEGAAALVARAVDVDASRRLPPAALAPLLETYGRSLPDLPGAGSDPRARAPLVLGARHPDAQVRTKAVNGLDLALSRFDVAGWPPAADAFLDGLAADGYDTRGLDYRRSMLALSAGAAPERALVSADRLLQRSAAGAAFDDRIWAFYGHYLTALTQLALRDLEAVEPALDRAAGVLQELRGRRLELREKLDAPRAGLDAAAAADLVELQAAVEWLRLVVRVAAGEAEPRRLLVVASKLHGFLLDAERLQLAFDLGISAGSLDTVLDRDLAPRRTLVANPELPGWTTAELLGVLVEACGWLATVAPEELPGIAPLGDTEHWSWRADAPRRARMVALRFAELDLVGRRMAVDRANRRLWIYREERLLERLVEDENERETFAFEDYRRPSTAALDLARDLRADGDAASALTLVEGLRAALDGASLNFGPVRSDQVAALVGREIGACLTDLGQPVEAEQELTTALERIEAVENSVADRIADLAAGRDGGRVLTEPEPDLVAALEAQRDALRTLRADLLVSLAVNANVRLGQAERAVGYFERAYELQQSGFMRVLLACYRARVGRSEEARFLLEGVVPAPELYYNLACTHALLGDRDQALEFLALEFASPRLTAGALTRQRRWAAEDPDLASLRGDATFEALVAPR